MTLQNKKAHLLDNTKEVDDIPDIFDQYGSDDVTTTSPVSQNVTRPRKDDVNNSDSDVDEVVSQESEKKWEQDTDEVSAVDLEQVIATDEAVNEQVVEREVQPPIAPPKPDVIEDDVKQTPIINETIEEEIVKQNEQQPIAPPKPDIKQENFKKTKEDLPPKAPVQAVAPVKQNYNSILQQVDEKVEVAKKGYVAQGEESVYEASASAQGVKTKKEQAIKKSYAQEKEKITLREINIDPGKKTIMIVDDDIDTLEMYADVFENADYNVIRAADGLEAINLVSKHTPHVIFTGIVMPRMDGFAMMESLKQNKRTADIPVVINSHLGRETDKKQAEELGARDFIIRGFTQPREVLERIGALLLRSEYIFHFDAHGKEANKLSKDLGASNFFHCPRGQEMVLKLNVVDEKDLTFSARFSCVDVSKDKK